MAKKALDVWAADSVVDTIPPAPDYVPPTVIEHDEYGYDIEGLMSDFPTATELSKFVYDQTGVVLNLKGRSNNFKYKTALDTLNGIVPPAAFVGTENPYLDKNELIPTEPLKVLPPRSQEILDAGIEVNRFGTSLLEHPHPEWKAQDVKCQTVFRKYENGLITFEVLGPIAQIAVGTRINKYGTPQPEKIVWVDPRQGEQVVLTANGKLTPVGAWLKTKMKSQRVNKSNQWDTWIDRDFIIHDSNSLSNPWGQV